MRVLTLDDNPMTGLLLADVLADLGHQAVTADDAAAARAAFDRDRPDVCILDWVMPDADGLELAVWMRRNDQTGRAYIIMLTGKQDLQSVDLAYEVGVDEVIPKPVAPSELKARLRAAARLIDLRHQHESQAREIAALRAELAMRKAAA